LLIFEEELVALQLLLKQLQHFHPLVGLEEVSSFLKEDQDSNRTKGKLLQNQMVLHYIPPTILVLKDLFFNLLLEDCLDDVPFHILALILEFMKQSCFSNQQLSNHI